MSKSVYSTLAPTDNLSILMRSHRRLKYSIHIIFAVSAFEDLFSYFVFKQTEQVQQIMNSLLHEVHLQSSNWHDTQHRAHLWYLNEIDIPHESHVQLYDILKGDVLTHN